MRIGKETLCCYSLTLVGLMAATASLALRAAGPKRLTDFDEPARALLRQMTLDEKIGQMTQPDQQFLASDSDVVNYHLGSVLSGGDSDPKTGNDVQSWVNLYDRFQSLALKGRLRIPMLYGIDAVHGHNNVEGAVLFPQNIALGCTRNPELVEQAARITAEEVRATGINWAFAPCVTVPQDIGWGRTYEGYSESPDVVKELGAAAVRGLQTANLDGPTAVLACAKHFAGDGGTTLGTGLLKRPGATDRFPFDHGDTRVDESTLERVHLPGYVTTIDAGVGSIMPSYSSWNGVKCSANKRLLTDILKGRLGFAGFTISDYDALNEIPGDYPQEIAQSINAGMDMVMVPKRYREFFDDTKQLVQSGRIPMSRIDDAVTRILRVKLAMGLLRPDESPLANPRLLQTFGSDAHRAVARQCVRESLVVLKNERGVLPLKKGGAHIHVAGKNANDIGNQCGGWTIKWQGSSGPVTKGTTILQGIRDLAGADTAVSFSADGQGAEGATVGVAVIGETPYAEMFGDRTSLGLAPEDVAVVDKLKGADIPVVLVIVSGRPLLIDAVLAKADAVVAAWQPGTEGAGVADVLFGDAHPKGKLSFTWPQEGSTTFNHSQSGYRTLFPFGHGLTY